MLRAILSALSAVFLTVTVFSAVAAPSASEEEIAEKARRRAYAGGVDEEDLKPLETLPAAARKLDARTVQRQVFKTMFNREAEDLGPPVDDTPVEE